jgi:hypothetical protein
MPLGLVNLDLGSIVNGASSLVNSIGNQIRGKIPVDEMELAKLQIQMEQVRNAIPTLLSEVDKAQALILAEDAKSSSFFKYAARPMALWVCVTAFALNYVIMPTLAWILAFFMDKVPTLLALDSSELTALLFGLLGLTAARSFDKMKK